MTKFLIELEDIEFINCTKEEQVEIQKALIEDALDKTIYSFRFHNFEHVQEFIADAARGDITPAQGFMFRALSILAEINGVSLEEVWQHIEEHTNAV